MHHRSESVWALGRGARVALFGAIVLILSSCGEDPPGPDRFGPWAGTCERVAEVIAESHSCRRDDECPCAMACVLGQCVSSCTENADCATGEVCDSFGRCTTIDRANRPIPPGTAVRRAPSGTPRKDVDPGDPSPGDPGTSPTDEPRADDVRVPLREGTLRLDRSSVELLSADAVASFRVFAHGAPVEVARVVARPGVLVQCDEGGQFGGECAVGPFEPEAIPLEIRVRSDGEWPTTDERASIALFAGTAAHEVGVIKRGGPLEGEIEREGVYEGTAWLVGAGLTARTTEDKLSDDLARLKLSVKAKIYAQGNGSYTVAFDEPRHAVFPRGAVGTLSVTSGSSDWQLSIPSLQYLGDDVDNPEPEALDVHARVTMTNATFRDGVLLGDVITRFEGVTTSQYAPFVRWRLSLSRSGALEEGDTPPSVVERPVADVSARAYTPFVEENNLGSIPDFYALTHLEQVVAAWCTPKNADDPVTKLSIPVDIRGDLRCESGSSQLAFSSSFGTLLERGDYIDSCVRAFDPLNIEWGEVSSAEPCANRARAVSTIALALTTDRDRALGNASTPNLPLSRLGSRALQLWLGAQSLTGSDPMRLALLGPLLPGGPDVDKLRYYAKYENAFEALQRSITAWDVLLHPRVGVALAAMAPEALKNPDYRMGFPDVDKTEFSGGEQSVGLPVNILAALTSQLEGVTGLVDALANQRITGREASRYAEELANFMPRSVVLFAIAQGLRDAARSDGPEPWENSWLAVRAKYGSALAKLSEDLRALEAERNPLGIEDTDLPLYRLGEQEGAHGRFSAVSDSLLGREDSAEPAIAAVLIDRAREAELLARESIANVLARDYESELQSAAIARNLESIKRYYGEQVTSLCGFDHLDSLSVLDQPELVDANTCFLAPECLPSPEEAAARASRIDQSHQACLYAKYRRVLGDAVTTYDEELDYLLDALEPSFRMGQPLPELPEDVLTLLQASKQTTGGLRLPATVDSSAILAARTLCDSAREASEASRPKVAPESCTTTDDCPVGTVCDGSVGRCAVPAEVSEACYQGALGSQLLAIRAAVIELSIAKEEFDDYTRRYESALKSCSYLASAAEKAAQLNAALDKVLTRLESAKLAMDIVEKTAQVVREIAASAATDPVRAASMGVQIVAGAVETAAFAISAGLAVEMEQAIREHANAIDALDRETEVKICLNEAEMELIGADAAQKRVARQEQEIRNLLYEFASMQSDVTSAIEEGLASLAHESARAVLPANADYWLDANVDLFQQRMRRARRALYLAILGVEYEFQQTSAERGNVLAAQTTADLEGILSRVRDGVRRGAPLGGGNPTELRSVLSLRKNILQLADRSKTVPGWHNLSDVERFQHLLVSPEFAVYDENGTYLGQEIPFSLAPIGTTGLADPAGIPLFSGLSCAERLWSVNAVVLGSKLMKASDTSITSLQIRKRNTFESQWCSGVHSTPSQIASTRPGVNLFIDPLSASSWSQDATLASLTNGGATAFSFATVQARLNIDQKTLESNDYTDGASTALAGRGAFGEYTVFIPRTSLSINGGAGLVLENVEDILIRLDYVAAERQ